MNIAKFNQFLMNDRTQKYLEQVLGWRKNQFISNLTALVANNQQLQEVEPVSLMYAAIQATALELPLDRNLGYAYVIPYKNGKTGKTEAQFQVGYRGFIQLALRSGQFETINVSDVREGEIKDYNRLTGEIIFDWLTPDEREKKPVIGYVAFFRLISGFWKMQYMTKKEIERHAKKYSQTYKRGFGMWKDDFEVMAKKTVLKLLIGKWAILSTELKDAIRYDQSVIRENGEPEYIDNVQHLVEEKNKKEIIERTRKFLKKVSSLDELEILIDNIPENIMKEISSEIEEKRKKL